jgi:hypothetical protein
MRRRAFLAAAGAVFAGAAFSAGAQVPAAPPALPPVPSPPSLPATPPAPVAPPPELEAIRSVVVGRKGLTIRVASHGCTRRADFAFFVERKAGVTTLAVGRRRIETCGRGRAGETALDFSFKDLGVDPDEPVVVLNPLLSAKSPRRR